jgi:dihydrofolate synthase / folylpolyglutamate synthase
MNFDESVKYLYGLGNEVLAMKLGLNNIGKLLAALGSPQKKYLKVQIAGTNGKGSTVAFLEAICLQAGIKTGATTSPHLISVTERVRLNGADIGETDFARHATRVRDASEKLVETGALETVPTYFEQVTAIALNVFAETKVELAILETGLGGRFDATTAADAEIVGITPIDYDHQRILGDTLTEIAAEKAAIIRSKKQQVVVARQKAEAEAVIFQRCLEIGVEPELDCEHFLEDAPEVSFRTKTEFYPHLRLNLPGKHQIQNAKVAILAAESLRRQGLNISRENVMKGLESAIHKGRLEFIDGILFDGAHNVAGARALREYLAEFHEFDKITLVFGAMKDKEIDEIAEILFTRAEDLILTESENLRAMPVAELKRVATKYLAEDKIFLVPDVGDAIDSARRISANYRATRRNLILVTGSLYLVGEAQKALNESNPNS